MKVITLMKFMTKEEFVDMITQIKNFKNPVTGKMLKGYRTINNGWDDIWHRAKYRFNMNNLDYVDALINPDGGYVRYRGAQEEVLDMLIVKFGFEEDVD